VGGIVIVCPVNALVLTLVAVLASTNPVIATSNIVEKTTGVSIEVVDPNDPVEKEFHKLTQEDDAAQDEVDKWIKDNEAFAQKGVGTPSATLSLRIRQRFDSVKESYETFLRSHPEHVRGRLAYGGFLKDIGREDEAVIQWEKAREMAPKNPACWNNLATIYGHRGPIKNAFEYFEKAIELKPDESVYYHNLAVHVYLFRKDAGEYYHLDEAGVFDKSLELYRKAIKLDPQNFILYTDYAECFYGTNPPRYKEGLEAWYGALKLARDEVEREGVYIHLARIEAKLGMLQDARNHLNSVTNEMYATTKKKIALNIDGSIEKTNTPSIETKQEK